MVPGQHIACPVKEYRISHGVRRFCCPSFRADNSLSPLTFDMFEVQTAVGEIESSDMSREEPEAE